MFQLKLKELREQRGLSQYKLAEELKVSQARIGHWESGTRECSFSMLIKLANYFNVSIDYLLGRSESSAVSVRDTQLNNRTKSELSDKFLEDYSQLLKDSSFIETTKLYNAISTEYRALCLGVLLGVLQQRGVDTGKILGY
ncbi:MAG: helix-turn-helix transcriptional regulator [Clostridia bacterium]|jgi:transcriptional regulator with XRE-family HTH domain|nr:helix-turn-helix transcriptional regulator [Clostridia bacterium]